MGTMRAPKFRLITTLVILISSAFIFADNCGDAGFISRNESINDMLANSAILGDPVLITTGKYIFEVEDFEIPGSTFSIKRKYISEENVVGSMGTGWLSSLDTRVIRGITVFPETTVTKITSDLNEMFQKIEQGREAAKKLLDIANDNNYNAATRKAAQEGYDGLMARADNLDISYLKSKEKVDELLAIKALGERLSALNKYSVFPGSPSHYEIIGNGYLTLMDENGVPRVYEPVGAGVWLPISSPERFNMRLTSVNGGDAENLAGFLLSESGGRKKHYNGSGLLAGIIEPNGNRVEIIRDGNQKISQIKGPHGNVWTVEYNGQLISAIKGPENIVVQYRYNGNELAWVQDREGDTGGYRYDNGRLKEIVKPDGSFRRITYGYTGNDGELLVSSTTDPTVDNTEIR
jgi:hypothetical protein